MTGFDIYESAITKLGYSSLNGSLENDTVFKSIAVDAINEIGADLCNLPPIKKLEDTVSIDKSVFSPLSYGVAMVISFISGDREKHTVMAAIFNAKRSIYLSGKGYVKDTAPKIYGG